MESKGRTPWEGAQVVVFEVLSKICQQHGDDLTGSVASTFPQVDSTTSIWIQHNRNALVRERDKQAESSRPAMSSMFAMMKMFYAR